MSASVSPSPELAPGEGGGEQRFGGREAAVQGQADALGPVGPPLGDGERGERPGGGQEQSAPEEIRPPARPGDRPRGPGPGRR